MERTYSQISSFKRCPKKYFYGYVLKLSPKKTRIPFLFGNYTHNQLEAFYGNKDLLAASQTYFDKQTKGLFTEEKEMYKDMKETVDQIMERYARKYQSDFTKYNILEIEKKFSLPIPGTPDTLNGKIDLILEDMADLLYVMEHKTTALSVKERLNNVELDEQVDYYIWALTNYLKDEGINVNVAGCIYNVIRKKLPTIPRILKKGGLTQDKSIDTTYEIYAKAIIDNNLDPKDYQQMLNLLKLKGDTFFGREIVTRTPEAIKNVEKDLVATVQAINNTTEFYRCASANCVRDCNFRELCIAEKNGKDTKSILENFEVREHLNPELADEDEEE